MDRDTNHFDKPFEPTSGGENAIFGGKEVFSEETKSSAEATMDKAKAAREDLRGAAKAASDTARNAADDIGKAATDIGAEAKASLDQRLDRLAKDIAAKPLTSVAIAALAGYTLAVLRGRRF